MLAWFIIDTAFSVLYDVTINVIVNVSVLLLALLPLLATYKEFRPASA
jgi:Mg/Co/Ni transporter MgtE